jgi:hypothetical protein
MDSMDAVNQSNDMEQQALESQFMVPRGPQTNEAAVEAQKLVYRSSAVHEGMSAAMQALVESTNLYQKGGRYFWPDPVPLEERTADRLRIRNGVVELGYEDGLLTVWRVQ